jgi:exosortase/archaeosortase family protein
MGDMKQKKIFSTIFIIFVFLLISLPFLVSFNEALTKLVEKIQVYTWLQNQVVPYEVGMVRVLLRPIGIDFVPYANGIMVGGTFLEMTWNCLGWQSLFLLGITLLVGLSSSGSYTGWSKFETVLIGVLGTFLINLFRLCLIVVIWVYLRPVYFFVYHNYLAAGVTVVWLVFFWWFSYKFVLQER